MKIIVMLIGLMIFSQVSAQQPDWTDYEQVLSHLKSGKKHDIDLILVDYPSIRAEGSLQRAYETIANFDTTQLKTQQEKLAFYINAYNILALKMVADHWPLESIKDVGSLFRSVWKQPAGQLSGRAITLGELEHQILRPMGEPRIHLAIVCASVSCPDLRREPYRPEILAQQLDDQAVRFLHNAGKGLRIEDHVIRISKIFDWFEEDFDKSGGVSVFIHHYRPDLAAYPIKANLPYDWSVNSLQ